MTTFAPVGAGPGLGIATAHRFGTAGHTVVLISRSNGGSAVRPHLDRAGTSIAFAAESAYARMLHDALGPENIHVAQLIIPGAIRPDAEHSGPDALARRLYDIHLQRDGFRHYVEPLPD
ncbi:hypothetical protein ACWGJB_48650 [Streptomyces sp. NPDC054813]